MKDFLAEIEADLEKVKAYIIDGDLEAAKLKADSTLSKVEERLKSIEAA